MLSLEVKASRHAWRAFGSRLMFSAGFLAIACFDLLWLREPLLALVGFVAGGIQFAEAFRKVSFRWER